MWAWIFFIQGNPDHRGIDRKSDVQSLVTKRVNSTIVSCQIEVTVQQLWVSHLPCIPKGEVLQFLNYVHPHTAAKVAAPCRLALGGVFFFWQTFRSLFFFAFRMNEWIEFLITLSFSFKTCFCLVGFIGKHQCCIACHFPVFVGHLCHETTGKNSPVCTGMGLLLHHGVEVWVLHGLSVHVVSQSLLIVVSQKFVYKALRMMRCLFSPWLKFSQCFCKCCPGYH